MKRLLTILLCLGLVGCAALRVDFGQLASEKYPPKRANEEILLFTSIPNRPYIEIGVVTIQAKRKTKLDTINGAFRERARKVGADAVINIKYSRSEKGGFMFIPSERADFARISNIAAQGIAVKFSD